MTGIVKNIWGLKGLDKQLSFGTNPSSVAQFILEISAKQRNFKPKNGKSITFSHKVAYNVTIIEQKWIN